MNLITLKEAREELWDKGAIGPSSFTEATGDELAKWDMRLNRVVQRIFERITPARTFRRIDVPVYDGRITLPRDARGLLGMRFLDSDEHSCAPLYIYSRFHEFAESGIHVTDSCRPIAQPLTETAQTFKVPEAGFKLRAISTETIGASYTFTGGTDSSDDEFHDSVELSITNGTTTTSRTWNTLPRIQKEETDVAVELYSVDSDGTATLIAIHAPGETMPAYQQYSVPDISDDEDEDVQARILTRLCYVKLVADNDVIFPSSYGALQLGLQALRYEDVNDWDNAEAAWTRALMLIDSDKELLEGEAEIPSVRALPGFACSGIPNIV